MLVSVKCEWYRVTCRCPEPDGWHPNEAALKVFGIIFHLNIMLKNDATVKQLSIHYLQVLANSNIFLSCLIDQLLVCIIYLHINVTAIATFRGTHFLSKKIVPLSQINIFKGSVCGWVGGVVFNVAGFFL